MADFYKSIGYSGLVISDHFYNGNEGFLRGKSWEERINLLCAGYEAAKKRGDEIGLSVFFAFEFPYCETHSLIYGLDKEWLLKHRYCYSLRAKEFFELVKNSGGYVVQAHPFREARCEMIKLMPRDVDAVETVNACCRDFENDMADIYATRYGLTQTCGTDNHTGKRERITALELDFEAKDIFEITEAIKAGKHKISMYYPPYGDDVEKMVNLCELL